MDAKLRDFKYGVKCFPWKFFSKLGLYEGNKIPVKFVVENADWAINLVGRNIKNEIDKIAPNKIDITTKPHKIVKSIVHFGSQYMWLSWERFLSNENQFIASFFHGKPEDGEEVKVHIDLFLKSTERLNRVVTASTLIEQRLLNWGVPPEKLIKIPLGVNTSLFNLPNKNEKSIVRNLLGIPKDVILIGSFQKDGTGWKNGLEPKLIKGPDLFVSTLKLLSEKGYPVFALLTGPARGYVKNALKSNGIPFFHTYPSDQSDLKALYHALDIYLITSREEGGPMGLLESIACGTAVASTKVGMAQDVINDKVNGVISDEIDAEYIAHKVEYLINMPPMQKLEIFQEARKSALKFDWKIVAKDHWEKIYKPLIS